MLCAQTNCLKRQCSTVHILHKFIFIFLILSGAAGGPNASPSTSKGTSEDDENMEVGENSGFENEMTESAGEELNSTGDLISEDIFNFEPFSEK